ncbi:hypothetical protein N7474_002242 [Penicillium riverlandense]|uniref:uncharacterized protein n=1 Tax=Penicillium riverlandense TaxID=1903569 RepID=UPI002547E5F5|nr:uncharacterized protein N7474_002242 [Penicillium riverlandense]KAJ5833931.1 hypothetical protein N7474_002242 [Penicillium riverlandense]
MLLSTTIARPLQLLTRIVQWTSAVIVMSLTAFLLHRGPKGQHLIYQVVIAVLSVVFFLPAFLSPFMPAALSRFVLAIDIVFSYLWLTAFIFAAQDYSSNVCYFRAPPGLGCSRKRANEAFMFLAFIFTFIGAFLEVAALWAYAKENSQQPPHEKNGGSARPPMDAPVSNPAPAGTV